MKITLKKIAEILGGSIIGQEDIEISGIAGIEDAKEGEISFISNAKYLPHIKTTSASAILVDASVDQSITEKTLLIVENVYFALARLLALFDPTSEADFFESMDNNYVSDDSNIGPGVKLGAFSVVEAGSEIGQDSKVMSQVYVGKNVKIGANCTIYPGVKIYHNCSIGDNVIIHSNAIIGSDGFGFAPMPDGKFHKIPQIGAVILENNVEIGANTVIDRGTMGNTIIREGTKLDNLIQVAHNVEIGAHTVIAAQAGIAGSTKIGAHCQIGGQAGIVGHLKVADQTMIQAQSGLTKSIRSTATKWYGSPAIDYNNYLKSFAIYKNLPDLQSRIKNLEKLLDDIQRSLK